MFCDEESYQIAFPVHYSGMIIALSRVVRGKSNTAAEDLPVQDNWGVRYASDWHMISAPLVVTHSILSFHYGQCGTWDA